MHRFRSFIVSLIGVKHYYYLALFNNSHNERR
jgi:hypothetical protein